jgi:hypothetical protein
MAQSLPGPSAGALLYPLQRDVDVDEDIQYVAISAYSTGRREILCTIRAPAQCQIANRQSSSLALVAMLQWVR